MTAIYFNSVLKRGFYLTLLTFLIPNVSSSQDTNASKLCIIDNIQRLESAKDPKCHATASRLEDFMYGTPLGEDARIRKTELQKKLILYIWNKATQVAEEQAADTINTDILKKVIDDICLFGRLNSGEWFVGTGTNQVFIRPNDLRQYSTVAYALRAMLSVEQDFLFNPQWKLTPMDDAAVEATKLFIDLITLAVLQKSDTRARQQNRTTVSPELFQSEWEETLAQGTHAAYLSSAYPSVTVDGGNPGGYHTINAIIKQKIDSYKVYNDISLPIFLRNIQVYFARHKWPKEQKESDALKNFLVESLVYFCRELLNKSDMIAQSESAGFIRAPHVNQVIPLYLPFEVNSFEDVIFFPELEERILIESYDLDAFRDSGIHWLILEYAIRDIESAGVLEPDPFAAELLVETVAQMALLVLRKTGENAVVANHPHIEISDMEAAFSNIQELIFKSSRTTEEDSAPKEEESIVTASGQAVQKERVFHDRTSQVGIDFTHRSADWLNRLIRSYVVKKDEQLVRMAIPPAFGGSGVAAEDINNDGWQDIVLLGGLGIKLYINNGDDTFSDMTEAYGIDTWDPTLNSFAEARQIIIVDFDNDGWQDLFVSLVNQNHRMYKNIQGTSFQDVSERAGLGGEGQVAGPATALDYDKDGFLDIYIGYFGNYLDGFLPTLSRKNQNGDPNVLFKNMGDFRFEARPYCDETDIDYGWTQAIGHSDINQDGWQDIIVGNDFGINAYYINQQNGRFKNMSSQLNTDKPSYTMNVGSSDLNGDHYPDLYISNIVVMEKDEKYVNPGGETKMNFELRKMENIRTVEANDLFLSVKKKDGSVAYEKSSRIGRGYSATGWSWDADFFDFDNDGDEDLYCLNGMNDFRVYGSENPYYNSPEGDAKDVLFAQSNKEKNNFFVNENGMLTDRASIIGGDLLSNSRSAAYLDFDRDGDLDIIVNNYHDSAVFLENKIRNRNNWIAVRLIGSAEHKINRDAIGANIIIKSEDNKLDLWREVKSTTGYLSVHPKMQYFGVGQAEKVDIIVEWPDGNIEVHPGVPTGREYTIGYGKALEIK